MIDAQIVVDPQSLTIHRQRPATGVLWVRLGSQAFPEEYWNDLAIVVLRAFTEALARLLDRHSGTERVYFMDGPFAVDMECQTDHLVRIRGIERTSQDREIIAGTTSLLRFAQSAATATRATLSATNTVDRDIEALRQALRALEGSISASRI